MSLLDRITTDSEVRHGQPMVGCLQTCEMTAEEVLDVYRGLEHDNALAALRKVRNSRKSLVGLSTQS